MADFVPLPDLRAPLSPARDPCGSATRARAAGSASTASPAISRTCRTTTLATQPSRTTWRGSCGAPRSRCAPAPGSARSSTLTTFASGVGRSWAERRVTVTGSQGASIEAASLWVHVTDDGRPKSLPDEFFAIYGEAIGDRKVSARLTHGEPGPDAEVHDWPLRFTDFDVLEHMNNAAYWSAVEEELSRPTRPATADARRGGVPRRDRTRSVRCRSTRATATTGCEMWMVVGSTVHASARRDAGSAHFVEQLPVL